MLHPLEKKVKSVARLARGQQLLLAGACVGGVALVAVFLAGLADYLFRFEDAGVRVIVSAGVLAAIAASVYWFLWPVLRATRGDLQVARRIERRYPQLGDRLSSSLVFLKQPVDEPTAGSPVLRRAVVAETAALTDQLDLSGAVDLARARRALAALSYLLRLLLLVCLLNPTAMGLAVSRLTVPWSDVAWPRRNDLAFVDTPPRIAAGSDFEVTVVDRNGRLPSEVEFEYWYDGDGSERIQSQSMHAVGGAMTLRLNNVQRPFKFRARGGDHDNMPWQALAVVEPPRIKSLDVTLAPPAYTGWPATASEPSIRALEGTRVGIRGQVTRTLAAARLCFEGDAQPLAEAAIDESGLQFVFASQGDAAWQIQRSGRYWIELVDKQGITAGADRQWNVTAVPDEPPVVSLERPGPTTHVTPQALVAVRALVKDDLALHTITLRYSRSDQSEVGAQNDIVLYAGPPRVEPAEDDGERRETLGDSGEQRTVEHLLDLSQIAGLQPGVTLELHLLAADYKPQSGQSTSRRLVIISGEELEDRIARRRASILRRLSEVLQRQTDTRGQTGTLDIQLAETGRFTSRDIDQLQSAELNQRQTHELLTAQSDSVRSEIEGLLDELVGNRVDSPEENRRMERLLEIVLRLGDRQMPEIEQRLITALKISRAALYEAGTRPGGEDAASGDSQSPEGAAIDPQAQLALSEAGRRQDEVIEELSALLGELSEWDNYRRFARDVGRLKQEQEAIASETDGARVQTLGKSLNELSGQQRAELRKLSQRQFDAARRLDQTLSRMQQMRDELAERDPLAFDTLDDALRAARDLAIGGQMHESGRAIEDNRLGQSLGMQREVGGGLEEMLDVLSNRREHELGRLVEQLGKAAEELEGLRKQQQANQAQLGRAAETADAEQRRQELLRLVKQQRETAEEIERLSRRLMRLQAEAASQSLGQAAGQAESAAAAADQGDAAASLESGAQAERSLERAQQELQQQLAQARLELAQEQLVRLEQEIQGLIARQQAILADTQRLDRLAIDQDGLDRAQQNSLVDLARSQRELAVETGAIGARLDAAEAFQLGLRGAAREMVRAAARLDRRQADQATQRMEQVALDRLQQIVAALAPESGDAAEGGGQGGEGQPGGGVPQQVTALAELKLLESMQQEINRRTAEIEAQRVAAGQLTAELQQELLELAGEQGRLADLMLNLSRVPAANPEDEPENLPELTPEATEDGSADDAAPAGGSDADTRKEAKRKDAPGAPLLDDLLRGSDPLKGTDVPEADASDNRASDNGASDTAPPKDDLPPADEPATAGNRLPGDQPPRDEP